MAQLTHRRPKVVTLILAAVLAIAGAGVAFAYWTAGGSGGGTATTGESTAFDIVVAAPVGDPLVPGGPGQTFQVTISNPAETPQTLTNVEVAIENLDGSPWTAVDGCSAADYNAVFTPAPPSGEVAGGASSVSTVTVNMLNSATNQDACQGADVPVHVTTGTAAAN